MTRIARGPALSAKGGLDCDVVVVGSGGGGGPATYELAAAGLDVICIEAGEHLRPEDFTQREQDTLARAYVDAGGQGPADGSVQILQGRAVGGSTLVNAEICFRTPDAVLEAWARDHGVRGMSPAEMAPVFDEVERMIHATVNEGRFLEPGRAPAEGLRKLGVEPKPLTRNVKDCRGCSYCLFGCAYGCKQSTNQSYLPAAMARGARVVCEAEVTRVLRDGDRVCGVVATTAAGPLHVRARTVVLACGAIQTPLLLLDHGLGGPEVGAHLAIHPGVLGHGLYPEHARPEQPATMAASYTDAWADEGYIIELATGSNAYIAYAIPGFGAEHAELARQVRHVWTALALTRDPEAPGRVRRDRKGNKVIEYVPTPEGVARIRRAMRRIAEMHLAGGATRAFFPTTEFITFDNPGDLARLDRMRLGPADMHLTSYHPQGTARMNTVTDNDGRVHGARGLYVMDTSLFPTPVGVNPQVSVMAVSTVLSRRLAAEMV